MRLPLLLLAVVSWSSLSAAADAPVSLTASDGTGLQLTRLQARAVVMDPLAFTELTLSFVNPLDRVIEGQFKVTLPAGATVSRFAMKLEGRWQEGEVVERQAARRAYEDFLHRRQDGLVELVLVEWKYTESYKPSGAGPRKNAERRRRYGGGRHFPRAVMIASATFFGASL